MDHHVFLSYAREDAEMMHRIYDDLLREGFTVWMDADITPGTPSWRDAIQSALENTACIVVLFSPAAKASFYVKEELSYGGLHQKPIYPLLIKGDEVTSIPFGYSSAQWVDLRQRYENLYDGLFIQILSTLETVAPQFVQDKRAYEESRRQRVESQRERLSRDEIASQIEDYLEQATSKIFSTQRADERVLLITHRHWWDFFRKFALILALFLLFVIVLSQIDLAGFVFLFIGLGIIALLATSYVLYANWRNTEIVVTDQRVLSITRSVLRFQTSISEFPLRGIDAVTSTVPNVLASALGYGTVEIQSPSGYGNLSLIFVPNPHKLQEVIFQTYNKWGISTDAD